MSECGSLATKIAHSCITDDNVIDQGTCNIILNDSDDDESLLSSSDGNDSSILNSSGIDSDLEEFIISSVKCTWSLHTNDHAHSILETEVSLLMLNASNLKMPCL